MKYRHIIVDKDDYGYYTSVIQCKKWYGWTAIKTLESNDREYLKVCAEDILDKLRENI